GTRSDRRGSSSGSAAARRGRDATRSGPAGSGRLGTRSQRGLSAGDGDMTGRREGGRAGWRDRGTMAFAGFVLLLATPPSSGPVFPPARPPALPPAVMTIGRLHYDGG